MKAANDVEQNVEIARRAEVHAEVKGQSTGKSPMTITACGSCQYFSINMLQDSDKVQVDNDVIPIGRETSIQSIPQEHHPKDGNKPHRVKTGDEVSEIASRIGVSLDEVGGKILKTLGTGMFRY